MLRILNIAAIALATVSAQSTLGTTWTNGATFDFAIDSTGKLEVTATMPNNNFVGFAFGN